MKFFAIPLCVLAAAATLLAEDPAKFAVGSCEFTRPADWKWVQPSSTMRKAQLQIPGKDGRKPADVTFYFFGEGQGGDAQANAQRWLGQFTGKPDANKVQPQEFNGLKVTLVSAEGTMKASPFGGQPDDQPDSALLGAIIEQPGGSVFVKMTGPAELVKASNDKFVAMLKTVTEKK